MSGGEVLVWQMDTNADNTYLIYNILKAKPPLLC